jgi:hypothetical protein
MKFKYAEAWNCGWRGLEAYGMPRGPETRKFTLADGRTGELSVDERSGGWKYWVSVEGKTVSSTHGFGTKKVEAKALAAKKLREWADEN